MEPAVGVEGAPDLDAARRVAAHLGTRHHEYVYTPAEAAAALGAVVTHLESYDPALVRSAVPNFFLARLASDHVKMMLTGEGADEAFAGYAYLAAFDEPAALQRESIRLLSGLHNLNLQRLDRMTMAHGLEGRVPFLDAEFLERAMELDPRAKLHRPDRLEKWPRRAASATSISRTPPAAFRWTPPGPRRPITTAGCSRSGSRARRHAGPSADGGDASARDTPEARERTNGAGSPVPVARRG